MRFLLLIAVLAASLVGCTTVAKNTPIEPPKSSLTVRVVDPKRVTLLRPKDRGVLLPAGAGPDARIIARGSFAASAAGLSRYTLRGVRDESGEIGLDWDLKVPLQNGEHQVLLRSDGTLVDGDDLFAQVVPSTLDLPALRLQGCAALSDQPKPGYRVSTWSDCRGALVKTPLVLETPWNNVAELRKRVVEPPPPPVNESEVIQGIGVLFSVGFWSAVGGEILLRHQGHARCNTLCKFGGYSLLTFGISLDAIAGIGFVDTVFGTPAPPVPAKISDVVVYPKR